MRGNGVAEFYFRQYLFACQARLLFKLNRPTEVGTTHVQPLTVYDSPNSSVEHESACQFNLLCLVHAVFHLCTRIDTTMYCDQKYISP